MGFKRPLVQIQSLGPKNRECQKALPVLWYEAFGEPAASCISIMAALRPWRRLSPLRPLVQIQSLGPNKRDMRKHVSFVWSSLRAAHAARYNPLRSNTWEGNPIPSQTHPMREGRLLQAASCNTIYGRLPAQGSACRPCLFDLRWPAEGRGTAPGLTPRSPQDSA